MKIIIASTEEQEEKIKELVQCFYEEVFPYYFSDQEIHMFRELQILHITSRHLETLGDAFKIITSLQTILSILQSDKDLEEYEDLFQKNVIILNELQVFFPFDLDQFLEEKPFESVSMYAKAANELLI